MGDQKADPSLVVDEGCVTLGDVVELPGVNADGPSIDKNRVVFVDLQLGGDDLAAQRLIAYADALSQDGSQQKSSVRDIVVCLRQGGGGRDFPRGFREKLTTAFLGTHSVVKPRWLHTSLPQMSVNSAISLLAHYWHTHALIPAIAARVPAAGPVTIKSRGQAEVNDDV